MSKSTIQTQSTILIRFKNRVRPLTSLEARRPQVYARNSSPIQHFLFRSIHMPMHPTSSVKPSTVHKDARHTVSSRLDMAMRPISSVGAPADEHPNISNLETPTKSATIGQRETVVDPVDDDFLQVSRRGDVVLLLGGLGGLWLA